MIAQMTVQKDPYSVLGLSRSASIEEVKRAFRKRIRTCHPDLAGPDRQNIQIFQEVKDAYHALVQRLDLSPQLIDPADKEVALYRDYCDNGAFLFLEVSAIQAFQGAAVETSIFDGEEFCLRCQGTGRVSGKGQKICEVCNATGYKEIKWGQETLKMVCQNCSGTGYVGRPVCPSCRGRGKIARLRRIKVNLPRGIRSGSLLRMPAQGPYRPERRARDPLFIEIKVAMPEGWRIKDLDVYAPLELDIWTALSGGTVSIETIEGPVPYQVDPGTVEGSILKVSGKGWVNKVGKRGDHLAKVKIVMPEGDPCPMAQNLLSVLRVLWPTRCSTIALPDRYQNRQE